MALTDLGGLRFWAVVLGVAAVAAVVTYRLAPSELTDEDRAATIALAKTLDFVFINVFVALFGIIVGVETLLVQTGLDCQPPWIAWTIVVITVEVPIALAVIFLPGTTPIERLQAFSERQAATVFSFLAFAPWLLAMDKAAFSVFNAVVDGALLAITTVFFVTKSLVSRRVRFGVLGVAIVPLVNLIAGTVWSRA